MLFLLFISVSFSKKTNYLKSHTLLVMNYWFIFMPKQGIKELILTQAFIIYASQGLTFKLDIACQWNIAEHFRCL